MRAVICLIMLLTSTVYPQWVKQNPLNPLYTFSSIDFINSNTGWCVGDSGTIVKTTNGGYNWLYQNLPSRLMLMSTKFINENTGFVCGDSGKILKTTNSGVNWTYSNSGNTGKLNSLFFVNQTTGFCAGAGILKTTNAGNNWFNSYQNIWSRTIFFFNEQTGWASAYTYYGETVIKTTNGGASWDTSQVSGLGHSPYSLFFINQYTGWATFDFMAYSIYKTTDGGSNWNSYNVGYDQIYSIFFLNENTGYGIGMGIYKSTNGGINWTILGDNVYGRSIIFKGNTGFAAGGTWSFFKSTNTGANWMNISADIQSDIYDVKALDANTCYVTGHGGLVGKTTNGGLNWEIKHPEVTFALTQYFLNPNTGWFAGAFGTILKTTDGCNSWIRQGSGTSRRLIGIYFLDSLNGWAGGDSTEFLRTTNGGANWIPINNLNNKYVYRILALSQNRIFIAGIATFELSTNGGYNWIPLLETPNIHTDICFINNFTGWASSFGNERLLKTTNGGLNWFPLYPDFAGPIGRIKFFDENTGWTINGNSAYRTTNGGYNWTPSEVSVFSGFNSIDFLDVNTGWAVGYFGLIYKTTNGGLIPVSNISTEVPKSFALYQNYPNPFNPTTIINYELPITNYVNLIVYDVLGREIAVLVNERQQAGKYAVSWDASNFPSGVYFYKLETDVYSESKKMVLLK